METGSDYVPTYESAVSVEGKDIDVGRESDAAQRQEDQAARASEKVEPAEKAETGETTAQGEEKEGAGKKEVPESLKKKGDDQPAWMRERLSHYAAESKALKAQLEDMRRELEAARQPANKPTRQPGVAPRQEDYDNYDLYTTDKTEFLISQREAAWRQQQEEQRVQQEFARQESEFSGHLSTFAKGFSDPQAVMKAMTSNDLPVTDTMGQAIMALGEKGAEVLFQLAQDPAKAYQLAQMSPQQVYMQIGMMAARQPAPAAAPRAVQATPTQSQPRPIPSIRGGAGGMRDDSPKDSDTPAEWGRKEARRMLRDNPGARIYIPKEY